MLTLTLLAAMVVQLQRGLKLLMVINQLGKLPPDQMQLAIENSRGPGNQPGLDWNLLLDLQLEMKPLSTSLPAAY